MSETRIRRANTKSDTPKRFILRSWYSFFLFFFFIFSCILSSRLVLWNSACIPCLLTRHILTYWQCLPKRVNLIKRHVKWTYAKWAKEIWRWKRDRKKERQRKSWMNECRTEPLKLRSNSYLNEQMELCVVFFFFFISAFVILVLIGGVRVFLWLIEIGIRENGRESLRLCVFLFRRIIATAIDSHTCIIHSQGREQMYGWPKMPLVCFDAIRNDIVRIFSIGSAGDDAW